MKQHIRYGMIVVLFVLALFFEPLGALTRGRGVAQENQAASPQSTQQSGVNNNTTTYLPLVFAPPGPPDFEIISPAAGWTVSGMMYFAAQARDPQTVNSVSFRAGATDLGTDGTPDDGFRAYFDASQFPAGALTLTAVAHGNGGQASKSISVNVVPDPPSSGMIGAQGGVLDSEIGSLITIPPGALPDGTQVTVSELSQNDVTSQNGIDWVAMGVTFLGAQSIQSTAVFSAPYQVASADFGPRVQPGQAVVNYQLLPDVDGDGVDEIVVVNTASVAPNNDVISDPIPQVLVDETATGTNKATLAQSITGGPPGTIIGLPIVGLNSRSLSGNVAEWTCADGRKIRVAGTVRPNPASPQTQLFSTIIPLCTPGPALVMIKNLSTGSSVGPVIVQVTAPPPVGGTPGTGTLAFLNTTQNIIVSIPTSLNPPTLPSNWRNQVQNDLDTIRQDTNNRMANPTPANQQALEDSDTLLSEPGSNFPVPAPGDDCLTSDAKTSVQDQVEHYFLLSSEWYYKGEPGLRDHYFHIAQQIGQLLELPTCDEEEEPPCEPAPAAVSGTLIVTGMGSGPPPGGNGCGNVGLPGGAGNRSAPTADIQNRSASATGGVVIKIFVTGSPTAFSGSADSGGYFFVPFIPFGQPFTAVAYDLASGDFRNAQGIGPNAGESISLYFDFFSPQNETQTVYWDGGGDGTSWHDPNNWSTNTVPDFSQDVVIDVPGAISVGHSTGTHNVRTLRSEEALVMNGGSLDIGLDPILNNSLTINNGTLTASGDMLVAGLLTWAQGTLGGAGTTTATGGILFNGQAGRFLDGRSLANTGNAVFENGSLATLNGANITNQLGAHIDFQGQLAFSITRIGSGTFTNLGTLTKQPGTGPGFIGLPFNHSGSFDIQDGEVTIHAGGTYTGTFQGAGGLIFDGGSNTLIGSISNQDLQVTNGAFNMNGSCTVGNTTLRGGPFYIAAGKTMDTNTLTLNGGTLAGDGNMRVSGLITWLQGSMLGLGTTMAQGGLFLNSASAVLASRTLENSGNAVIQNGILWTQAGATITNLPGATFDIQSDISINNDGSGTFDNQGNLTKSSGSGIASIGMAFGNSGSVGVQSGELKFAGGFTQTATGTLLVEIGGLTPISEFDQYTITGAAALDGALDVSLTGGFTPASGDSFEVLNFGSYTGGFAAINGHGQGYNAIYEATRLTLVAP